ncbi:MAG: PIG-L family deacetylase [Candidatus Kerfeldbacteria bacterium]|nr:PIG-L family deacetylase [Candidatus Kerfeldbacteria bacterium]
MKRRTILCVFAHPDDECFMCGGTIAACAARGDRVILVTATGGEAFTQQVRSRRSVASRKQLRRRELRQSSRTLGIARVHVLDFPDGQLAAVPLGKLHRTVASYLHRYQPDAVFSFAPDGVTRHRDHQVISRVVQAVAREQHNRGAGRPHVCLFGWPNHVRRRLGLPAASSQRHYRLSVGYFVNRKLRAIAAHRSQIKTKQRFAGLSPRQQRQLFQTEYVVRFPGEPVAPLREFLLS